MILIHGIGLAKFLVLSQLTDAARMRGKVRPSVRSTAATATGGFDAERRRLQQISIDSYGRRAAGASAQQQMRLASYREPTEETQHRIVFSAIRQLDHQE